MRALHASSAAAGHTLRSVTGETQPVSTQMQPATTRASARHRAERPRQRGNACALIKHAGDNADESVGMREMADEHRDHAVGHHAPGQYARASVRRLRMRTLLVLGALAVATALVGRGLGLHDDRFLAATEALLVCMFAISRVVLPLVDRRDRGASAEEHVGQLRDGLPAPEWRVIHDAPTGHGNIDHVVIGRAGVFMIETKGHPGPVHVRRVHPATLRQVHAERKLIEEATGRSVEGLLVFSRAWVDRPLAKRKGVRVVPARLLLKHLLEQPAVLPASEAEQAYRRLRSALGWESAGHLDRSLQAATRRLTGRIMADRSGAGDRDGGDRGDARIAR